MSVALRALCHMHKTKLYPTTTPEGIALSTHCLVKTLAIQFAFLSHPLPISVWIVKQSNLGALVADIIANGVDK